LFRKLGCMRSCKCKFNFCSEPKAHIEYVQPNTHPVPNTHPQNDSSRVFPRMNRLNLPAPTPTLALPPSLHALLVLLYQHILIFLCYNLFYIFLYFFK
jgi:hypothetical protein